MATCKICNTTVLRGGKTRAAFNTTHLVRNITEKVINLIALDNQLISMVEDFFGFLHHLEFLNPWYALPS